MAIAMMMMGMMMMMMMIIRMAATINFIDGAVDNLQMIVFICFLFLFALYLFVCLHVCLFVWQG